jgi:hypothetical protein
MRDGNDDLWLREQVEDEEILGLFAEDPAQVHSTVRHLIERAAEDDDLEARLIETLETGVDQLSDDTQASVWIAVVLGEIRSQRSLGVLLRILSDDSDESLVDAASLALLRIGQPAMDKAMDCFDDDPAAVFRCAAYRLLGQAGLIEDPELLQRIGEFLDGRLAAERGPNGDPRALEAVAEAYGRLGMRSQLEALREVLKEDFHGSNFAVQDSIEMLEENSSGTPFVPTIAPWRERYGWLFDGEGDDAEPSPRRRRPRRRPIQDGADARDEDLRGEEVDLSNLYWGLSTVARWEGPTRAAATEEEEADEAPKSSHDLDARRFLKRPAEDPDGAAGAS